MMDIAGFLSALSEPTRLGALRLLADGREHCVCELMELLGATQSRMSRHMSILKAAGVVTDRRDAQWVRYRRNPDLAPELDEILNTIVAAVRARDTRHGTSARKRRAAA
jgi:ArsR family transcriptional regulator